MPINIPDTLPANSQLRRENIFVMNEERASHQDIRPLKIAILNLMPKKIETETQLLRVLSNSPLQVDIELIQTESHRSRNTSEEHLFKFYKTIISNGFDYQTNFVHMCRYNDNWLIVFSYDTVNTKISIT